MSKKNKRYPKEFKLEAIKLVTEQGLTQSEAAKNLGISQGVLGTWVRKFQANGFEAFPGSGKSMPEEQRIRDLEKKLKRVSMERDILKKAIGFFTENQN